jgi:hypothetical protein
MAIHFSLIPPFGLVYVVDDFELERVFRELPPVVKKDNSNKGPVTREAPSLARLRKVTNLPYLVRRK